MSGTLVKVKILAKKVQTSSGGDRAISTPWTDIVYPTVFIILLVVSQQMLVVDLETRMGRALLNAAHTPWFFLISILLWISIRRLEKYNLTQRLTIYAVVTVALSLLLEATQMFNAREASWGDVFANILGAVAAILALYTLRKWQEAKVGLAMISALLLVAIGLIAFRDVGSVALLKFAQLRQAPILVDFNDSPTVVLDSLRGAWVPVPEVEVSPGYKNRQVASISLTGASRYPGLTLREPLRDWRPYHALVIDCYLPSETFLDLDIRLETFSSSGLDSIYTLRLTPGRNQVRIPLSLLYFSDKPLYDVKNLYLYREFDGEAAYFWLASLSLE